LQAALADWDFVVSFPSSRTVYLALEGVAARQPLEDLDLRSGDHGARRGARLPI
jgi:hypothetical protein